VPSCIPSVPVPSWPVPSLPVPSLPVTSLLVLIGLYDLLVNDTAFAELPVADHQQIPP